MWLLISYRELVLVQKSCAWHHGHGNALHPVERSDVMHMRVLQVQTYAAWKESCADWQSGFPNICFNQPFTEFWSLCHIIYASHDEHGNVLQRMAGSEGNNTAGKSFYILSLAHRLCTPPLTAW